MNKDEIRLAKKEDIPGIIEIYKPFILNTAITFDEEIPSEEEMWQKVQKIQRDHPYLVCIAEGEVAGYAYYSPYRERASYRWAKEISVYVHPDFRRKNIAKRLYSSLFNFARKQGVFTLLAIITIPNEPSIRFHEKMGFVKCAEFKNIGYKLGQWQTVGWWQLSLFDEQKIPGEIVPLKNLI